MSALRFHSDCDYFAGCENMLAVFFADESLAREHALSFSCRPSPDYEKGFRERVPRPPRLVPLDVVDYHQVSHAANAWPAPLRFLYKALLRLFLVKYWLFLWDLAVLYRSFGPEPPDLLHINNGGFPGALSCLAAGPAARLRGVRKVVHMSNNLPIPYRGPARWMDWPLERLAVWSADLFVMGSRFSAKNMVETLGLPEARVTVLPNGIADRPIAEDAPSLRRRLGVPDGRPLVAVVAVLEPRKGHEVLLDALAALKKSGLSPFPVTALGGDGPLRPGLERKARALGLEGDVLFLGWLSRHFDLFNAADIVVLPSVGYEDVPNVIVEGLSLGKPVVATRVGGIAELFTDGESGFLARPGDADDLARLLGPLCQDEALRTRTGRRARERFLERFTTQDAVGRYLDLYRTLLK